MRIQASGTRSFVEDVCSCIIVFFVTIAVPRFTAPVIGEILDRIIPIIVANIHPDKDVELRLKLFSLVTTLLQKSAECQQSRDR